MEGDKPKRKKFDSYPIGYFHIDLAEVRTAEGKLYLFVATDRTSKFVVVELVERADVRAAAAFLEALVQAVPYIASTRYSPITESSSRTCPGTDKGQRPASADIPSTEPAASMASGIDSPSLIIPGPTVRSSG